jgi:ABC-type transport system involved in cytochrome bd biosynthesis fused ATPase/permease subunit
VTAVVVPPLAILTLALVDWPSAVVVTLTVPLLPVFAALIGANTRESTQRRWRALASLSGHFLDVMRGLPTLVSYGRAERQVDTIRSVSQKHRLTTMETLRLAFLSSAALELLATISVAMVAVTVGIRLAHGSMALGTALLAILLAPEAYWPIRRVGAEFHAAADGAEALAEITGHLAAPGAGTAAGTATPQAATVSADAVSYTYPGTAVPVLADVSLDVGPGLTVVTGPSGTGKTTLLEVLAGVRHPQSGAVTAPRTHLVGQRAFLMAATVRANLALGNDARQETMWQALRDVGLDGVVAAMPQGLDTPIGDDGFGLSAGQRARLVLARALLAPETAVLLDEPTAHLDGDAAEVAHAAICSLAARRCVIAVSHRAELVALADRLVHLEGGHLRQDAGS